MRGSFSVRDRMPTALKPSQVLFGPEEKVAQAMQHKLATRAVGGRVLTAISVKASHVTMRRAPQQQGHELHATQPAIELPQMLQTAERLRHHHAGGVCLQAKVCPRHLGIKGSSPPSDRAS